ncbi:DUF397 domain-containing protein [Streptomyces sp. NPDC005811]|uniref:DUF397 domain-containing protein n=1 Tax=Streptomyces sp. NPDC005811 TaxID=3154565 RepID=UPI0033E20484
MLGDREAPHLQHMQNARRTDPATSRGRRMTAALQWQKSSFSSGSDGASCVELAHDDSSLLLRESDDPTRILPVTPTTLAALLTHLRPGHP